MISSLKFLADQCFSVFNYNAYPALIIFENGKHSKYAGGREAKDIVAYMTAVSKGLDPQDEEVKSRPGLYKGFNYFTSSSLSPPFILVFSPGMTDYDPKIFMELEPETMESTVLADQGVSAVGSNSCFACGALLIVPTRPLILLHPRPFGSSSSTATTAPSASHSRPSCSRRRAPP
jgi:hypothetical protein